MKAIYINGINTTLEEAEAQAAVLNRMLDCKVVLCYNPTFSVPVLGTVVDLAESFYNRVFPGGPNLPVTRKLLAMIREEIINWRDTVVIAHSQGTAIAANALKSLNKPERTYVQAHFFAAVNSHEPEGMWGELFVNDEDPVRENLIVSNLFIRVWRWFSKPKRTWKQYTRPGNEHSFLGGHIEKLEEFSGFRESLFYKLMNSSSGGK